jgi:hypothetical protein
MARREIWMVPIYKGDLGPLTSNGQWFGPEYGFGQIIGDHYASDDVLMIKTAWGGHTLAEDFRPPSAVAARGGEVGASYREIFDDARQVLDNLGSEFPEWAGRGYQIVGFRLAPGHQRQEPDRAGDSNTRTTCPTSSAMCGRNSASRTCPSSSPPPA